ncbi:MAG: MiaB/RimO family radical SAM methylthiotransferase [Candidatus Nealsonbacteria bacterium]
MRKYRIITYGCQMNKADSERIMTDLENKGYSPASDIKEADLIAVNMCSVRQSAVDRVYGLLPKFKELRKNKRLKTILTGCLLKKDSRKLREGFDVITKKESFLKCPPKYRKEKEAFLPISNGCNNFCSYCVVPLTRGKLVCRDHKIIIKEAEKIIKKGVKEIWLLGQNVNDYQSPTKKTINFPKLLRKISDLPGNFSIRFVSSNPKNFSDELIKTMADSEKIAKYLNLPVQSGDNKILKRMNRPYTAKQYKSLVSRIRNKMPNINLSTDVIVGFPGETESQFQNTAKLFKEIGFDIAYINKYSPRPQTAAFLLKNNITQKEKKRRERILKKLVKHG